MLSEELPKAPTAPAQARRLLERLDGQIPRTRLEDARLLVSEVVANAVEHVDAEGQIHVSVQLEDGRLRVDVDDPGRGFSPRRRDPESSRGWGLFFVERLADRWGVAGEPHGHVWFELTA